MFGLGLPVTRVEELLGVLEEGLLDVLEEELLDDVLEIAKLYP